VVRHRQVEGLPALSSARVTYVDGTPFPMHVDGDYIGRVRGGRLRYLPRRPYRSYREAWASTTSVQRRVVSRVRTGLSMISADAHRREVVDHIGLVHQLGHHRGVHGRLDRVGEARAPLEMPDVVDRPEVLIPPARPDALAATLRRLLLDAELRGRLGDAARKRIQEEFTVGRMVRAKEAMYLGVPNPQRI
jgi:hypothetical protein